MYLFTAAIGWRRNVQYEILLMGRAKPRAKKKKTEEEEGKEEKK